MLMNFPLLHQTTFVAMYLAAGLATFVIGERLIFYVFTLRHARQIEALLIADGSNEMCIRDSNWDSPLTACRLTMPAILRSIHQK